MNRLQKRCLYFSLALHLLLLSVLVVGPAFVLSRPSPINDLPILDIIPAKLVDELVSGGGARGAPPPGPRIKEPTPPRVAPPPRAAVKPANEPVPPAPSPKMSEEIPADLTKTRPSRRHVVEPDLTPVFPSQESKSSTRRKRAEEAARQEAEAAAARQREFGNAISSLRSGLSGNTSIEPIEGGVGGTGGEAYANYAQAIKSIYDHAWYDPPDEVTDESLNVQVKIVINRDGRVLSDRIVGPSGNATLDKSIRRALDRVKQVPPFPAGAKDQVRSYTINFNLRAKRYTG